MLIPILTYHSVDDSGSVISIPPQKFREHMMHLKNSGYTVIPLSHVIEWIQGERTVPSKSVAITFDDGYRSFQESAFGVLQECGFPSTVFLVTNCCGRKNDWEGQPAGIPLFDLMDWSGIRELSENGVEFGAHSMNHPNLAKATPEQAGEEIRGSRATIRDRIGKDSLFFSYPYGIRTEAAERIVRDEYAGACSVEMDFVSNPCDRYVLPRIDMYYFSRNDLFSRLGSPSFRYYVRLRKGLRSLRARSY